MCLRESHLEGYIGGKDDKKRKERERERGRGREREREREKIERDTMKEREGGRSNIMYYILQQTIF